MVIPARINTASELTNTELARDKFKLEHHDMFNPQDVYGWQLPGDL